MRSEDLEWLLLVFQAGSLSGAAKARNVAVSTAARRIVALEATLNLNLLDRRSNGSKLSGDGQRIAMLAQPIVESTARLARAATAMRATEGQEDIRVSATEFIVSDVLAPALPLLWANNPSITVTLQADNSVVSLASRRADLAVRMSQPEGNSLVAKKLRPISLGLFASSDYLGSRSITRDSFKDERLLVYDDTYGRLPELDWISRLGLEASVYLRTGSTRALLVAALSGAGLALLPIHFGRAVGLIQVPASLELPVRTPWIVVHEDLRTRPNVRAVHDWIQIAFGRLG